jgi:hypothetical protein
MKQQWNERYGQGHFYYETKANDLLVEFASQLKKNSKILRFTEGEEQNAVFLTQQDHQGLIAVVQFVAQKG